MIQKPIVPPPVIFIGCVLMMAYLPNPYPFSINVLIAYLMVLVSSAIVFFSLWQFYKSKANINPIHLEKSNVFVVDGIYRFSRNPMYLSLAGLLVAWAVYLQSAVSFLGVFLFVYLITQWQIKPEEYWLEKKFGEPYLAYKKKVRRWI
jgi:raw score 9.49